MEKLEEIKFEIITLNWEKIDYKNIPLTTGVYQIYGTSPLYGLDTLLYIGKAINLNHRIKGHFEFVEGTIGRQPNKSCRIAKVPEELLTLVEETLIIMHKPSFNSARLINMSRNPTNRAIYIQNQGDRGLLNNETTNYYFLDRNIDKIPDEMKTPDDIK